MKKINKLIAIVLVAVCVLSGCAGSNTGKQEETVTMRATVTSFEKAGFLVTPEDGSEELKSHIVVTSRKSIRLCWKKLRK